MGQTIFTIIISLLGVIGLILFTYYGASWLNKRVKFTNNSMVQVHEKVNLGADKAMMVVSVGGKYMLIGVTQSNISMVCELDGEEISKIIEDKKTTPKMSFSTAIASAIAGRNKKGGGDNDKE